MTAHEIKSCPRCNQAFECKSGTITLCQCNNVTLTEADHEYISAQYDDCLCAACLTELRLESVTQHQTAV